MSVKIFGQLKALSPLLTGELAYLLFLLLTVSACSGDSFRQANRVIPTSPQVETTPTPAPEVGYSFFASPIIVNPGNLPSVRGLSAWADPPALDTRASEDSASHLYSGYSATAAPKGKKK